MEIDVTDLPIIDWQQGLKLAGNKKNLAEEILNFLIKTLPGDLSRIHTLNTHQNYPSMLKEVHKLHGALCYTGLPRVKTIVSRLETDLKNNIIGSLSSLLNQLDAEVTLLLEYYPPAFSSECSSKEKVN